jgi:hypothetical protein
VKGEKRISNPFIFRDGCVHFEGVDGWRLVVLYISLYSVLACRTGQDWGGLGRTAFVYRGNGLILNGMEWNGME